MLSKGLSGTAGLTQGALCNLTAGAYVIVRLGPQAAQKRIFPNRRFVPLRDIAHPFCLCRKPFSLNAGRPAGCAEVPLPSRTNAIGGHPIAFQWNDTGAM